MKIVFVCVGTPKIIGDSVGPKVGSFLTRLGYNVYGTEKEPITSINIARYENLIRNRHSDDFVIGIDAAFGDKEDLGCIKVSEIGIRPGGAYNVNNKRIGDLGLLAIVADRDSNKNVALYKVQEILIESLTKKLIQLAQYISLEFSKKLIKSKV